jgi:hypothetical protein
MDMQKTILEQPYGYLVPTARKLPQLSDLSGAFGNRRFSLNGSGYVGSMTEVSDSDSWRWAALTTIVGYGVSQVVMALRGKDSLLPHIHNLAWFHSSRKKLPTESLEELYPGSAMLTIRLKRSLPKVADNMTTDELAVIAIICQCLKPSVVFEFGTFNGRTTLNLAANTSAEAKIYPVFPEQADD